MPGYNYYNVSIPLGEQIKVNRLLKNWSQEHLAAECQITTSTLVKIEDGRIDVSFKLLQKIAAVLDVPLNELLENSSL